MPSSSGGSGSYKPNNTNNDPYQKRDNYGAKDAYTKKDVHAQRNVWKKDDVHEDLNERGERGGSGLCSFWFECKLKMQSIYSSDAGLQAEGRVFNTDTDPFIIQLFIKFSVYGMTNLFIAPTIIIALFIASLYAHIELKFLILVVELLYIGLILYCPAWQTFTSGQFAITNTGEEFYSKWLKGYKGYEGTSIFGYTVGVAMIATLAKFRFPFTYIYDYFEFDIPSEEMFMDAVYFVTISNTIFLVMYFILVAKLKTADNEKRKMNKRINIDSRTMSIVGQLGAHLDRAE